MDLRFRIKEEYKLTKKGVSVCFRNKQEYNQMIEQMLPYHDPPIMEMKHQLAF